MLKEEASDIYMSLFRCQMQWCRHVGEAPRVQASVSARSHTDFRLQTPPIVASIISTNDVFKHALARAMLTTSETRSRR
jgi:hypothetical protein